MKHALRAISILTASSILVAVASVLRYKAVAQWLGSSGVGTLGLMVAVTTLAITVVGLGLGTSGVRSVAQSAEDVRLQRTKSLALLIGSGILAVIGFVAVSLLAGIESLTGIPDPPWEFRVAMGATVASTVFNAGQLAFLNGRGRLHLMAVCNIAGAAIGTVLTLVAVGTAGYTGLAVALAGVPLATAALTAVVVKRDLRSLSGAPRCTARELWSELRGMAALGVVVTLALTVGSAAQLGARLLVRDRLGLEAAGLYQATWVITTLYLSFLLASLGAEYFPRISRLRHEPAAASRALDDQIVLTLLIAGPIIAWAILLAPLGLRILYSAEFTTADELLRWQLAGDVLKLPGWAVGFLLLATERRLAFLVTELVWNATFLALLLPLSQAWGLTGVGVASLVAYTTYLLACYVAARRACGYLPRRTTLVAVGAATLLTAALLASTLALGSPLIAGFLALSATAICAVLVRRQWTGQQPEARVESVR
ncbi:oligosaccharide flippase family protein [Nocardioides dongkuii]|uniref:oligosaccharide flippase family protein n=1 Tax=Nocardioides dongkuii TaxID=2760089 RepID=UPI0015FDA110|nr:oligosaccharide flippase family protein [Nocardioides dongkuii]